MRVQELAARSVARARAAASTARASAADKDLAEAAREGMLPTTSYSLKHYGLDAAALQRLAVPDSELKSHAEPIPSLNFMQLQQQQQQQQQQHDPLDIPPMSRLMPSRPSPTLRFLELGDDHNRGDGGLLPASRTTF